MAYQGISRHRPSRPDQDGSVQAGLAEWLGRWAHPGKEVALRGVDGEIPRFGAIDWAWIGGFVWGFVDCRVSISTHGSLVVCKQKNMS